MASPKAPVASPGLGLSPDRVELVPHASAWSAAFEREAAAVRAALGALALDVQHVGSTAVPGMLAKPILDIAVALARASDGESCVRPLTALGYDYRGDFGLEGGHLFVKGDGGISTHHLHAVDLGGPQWVGYLALRDHLRASAEARRVYVARKRELAALHPRDREAYTRGKTGVVLGLIQRALAGEGAPAKAPGD